MTLNGLRVALQFLTRLPVPPVRDRSPDDLARSAVWFPVAGALIGGFVALALWGGAWVGPAFGALCALVVWALITGALHLDGLGDVADGLGAAHRSRERFLEAVRDPHAGSFAVVAIVLQLLAKLVLLAELPGAPIGALILVPAWARWAPLVLGPALPALGDGLGARFARGIGWRPAAFWALVLSAASLWLAPSLMGALVIVPALALFWKRRLGGITGDCHGASIEVTETLLLAVLVVAAR